MDVTFFVNIVIGGVVGVAASVVAWRVILAWYVPRFEMSKIRVAPDRSRTLGVTYAIKVKNQTRGAGEGKPRAALMEPQVVVTVGMLGVNPSLPRNRTYFEIPTKLNDKSRTPLVLSHMMYQLHLAHLGEGDSIEARFPGQLREGLRSGSIGLRELLSETRYDPQLRIDFVASHAWSGIRRGRRWELTADDVIDGRFEKVDGLVIAPLGQGLTPVES